ncbi:protein tyrosine phosphatase [Saccharibacillus brassicae]|uniref:Protein tyrosine phosphatase n=2 Tax=Paenibacillaceae TaxID=186822 RepID=A0A4Y6V5U9_SACBS|nr:protein tyrosine phosphatase [Saccharibacillus brassicae]
MQLLFICSRNKWRSLTAEHMFNALPDWDVRSAGTENGARVKVTGGHIGWADTIMVMEKRHTRRLKEKFAAELRGKRLICLDIPDDYGYMDEELIELLKNRVAEHLELPADF